MGSRVLGKGDLNQEREALLESSLAVFFKEQQGTSFGSRSALKAGGFEVARIVSTPSEREVLLALILAVE